MQAVESRDSTWSSLDQFWDLIIIGGGITGAGILREATRVGLRALLVEGHDFASGTSSRSSKMVHGGFRYLKTGQVNLTLQSVRERERLLNEGRGLVTPLGFLLACCRSDRTPRPLFGLGLIFYDLLALKWGHRYYRKSKLKDLCPPLNPEGLLGGYRFFDAQTDDARLVFRLIQESVRDGGTALNYACVPRLLHRRNGEVCGVIILDQTPQGGGRSLELEAQVVVNATGAWGDELRAQVGGRCRLRRLRGSHLIFPAGKLPINRAVSFLHPRDQRFVFAFPWEGVVLVGTTDVDHGPTVETDPAISAGEIDYLMEAVHKAFSPLGLGEADIQATFSGVRPVIGTGKADPSKESREHVLWDENGLLTVAGGKLTTFRVMALDALKAAFAQHPQLRDRFSRLRLDQPLLALPESESGLFSGLDPAARMRLLGRYGACAADLLAAAAPGELEPLGSTPNLWAELRWAACCESAVHLDDLLLRRLRLGLLLPQGGQAWMDRIRAIVQPEMKWDDHRWNQELEKYTNLWKKCYHLPQPTQAAYQVFSR